MTRNEYIEKLKRYNNIIKEPYERNGVIFYEAEFSGLYELYEFLKSNPPVNMNSFPYLMSQQSSNKESKTQLYEMSYDDALGYLLGGYKKNLDELFVLKKELDLAEKYRINKTKVVKSFTGSRICLNGFTSNSPKRFYKLERIEEKKFVTIDANLAFRLDNNIKHVLHRGVLLHNLIKVLEVNNYKVAFNTFMLLKKYNEYIYIKIHLKEVNSSLSLENTVFPLTSVAFFRRIMFRVMESMPVLGEEWGNNYGTEVSDVEAKKLLNIPSRDIFVGTPTQIGVLGIDLREDMNKFLEYVNIENYVKVMKR